ncbi:MAG: helix-turn-helix domain-containing protein [Planctomycetota bacterium]
MRAYDFVISDPNLKPAEKLVIVVICRYWPKPCWQSNERIAEACGFTKRYVEKLIRGLANKSYIRRGYAHIKRNGRLLTCRVIVPLRFPKQMDYHQVQWIQTEPQDGQATVLQDDHVPPCSSQTTAPQDDQLEKNRKGNRNAASAPLPAEGQAPALLPERSKETMKYVEQIKTKLGIGKKAHKALTEEECQDRKQKQLEALQAAM